MIGAKSTPQNLTGEQPSQQQGHDLWLDVRTGGGGWGWMASLGLFSELVPNENGHNPAAVFQACIL